jgi:photosystem II stability/assembly factor-like uncharacterized protein
MSNYSWSNNKSTTKGWSCGAINATGLVILAAENAGRVYITTDGGSSWTETQPKGAADGNWYSCAIDDDGSHMIIAEFPGKLYVSTNSGSSWSEVTPAGAGSKDWGAVCCDSDGSVMCAAEITYTGALYVSTDSGSSWSAAKYPPGGTTQGKYYGLDCDSDGSVIVVCDYTPSYVAASRGRVWISTDTGSSWTESRPDGDTNYMWADVACDADGSHFIACAQEKRYDANGGRAYISTNSGSSWSEVRPAGDVSKHWGFCAINLDGSMQMLAVGITASSASAYAGRIYSSVDTGANWVEERPEGDVDEGWFDIEIGGEGYKALAMNDTATDPIFVSIREGVGDFMPILLHLL